jgi:Beta-ketoacyl synthase, N-terminal domain
MHAYIEGIGLCGPGLDAWQQSIAILAGHAAYLAAPAKPPALTLLPAAERRRAPQTVKLALAVGTEAFAAAGRDPITTPTIFASSGGDGETINDILSVLASAQRELSPTRFHNSVHNAAAGYWSIATGATAASTSLCAHDDSFAAGLLEALAQTTTGQAVALIAYDVPYPSPLFAVRPVSATFGVALVLSPTPTPTAFARLDLALQPGAAASTPAAPALEVLRPATPAARCLPLLEALAKGVATTLSLSYLTDMHLQLTITPERPA